MEYNNGPIHYIFVPMIGTNPCSFCVLLGKFPWILVCLQLPSLGPDDLCSVLTFQKCWCFGWSLPSSCLPGFGQWDGAALAPHPAGPSPPNYPDQESMEPLDSRPSLPFRSECVRISKPPGCMQASGRLVEGLFAPGRSQRSNPHNLTWISLKLR